VRDLTVVFANRGRRAQRSKVLTQLRVTLPIFKLLLPRPGRQSCQAIRVMDIAMLAKTCGGGTTTAVKQRAN
jgi:hypothetical protein